MNLQQTAFAIYELMKSFSILKITNCMTRLRLQLNTEDIANLPLKELKNIPNVLGVTYTCIYRLRFNHRIIKYRLQNRPYYHQLSCNPSFTNSRKCCIFRLKYLCRHQHRQRIPRFSYARWYNGSHHHTPHAQQYQPI